MIELLQGDITLLEVDAIVCPAHKYLSKGRGLSAVIHEKAGPELDRVCETLGSDCTAGNAVITPGFNLPCKFIIHSVTPLWTGGDQWGGSTLSVLGDCFRNAVRLAEENNVNTIAFPALGAGTNRTPHSIVAHEALEILIPATERFQRLIVCLHNPVELEEWNKVYQKFYGD
ncbi:macro domain-containing protein [Hahella ganghwensis]|uniref:macro domain-containing protein n=1 Tax=Hahella ganghwensis TaxID=286420 RepID=UPI0003636E4A|nr:macro domain-containing protein [Hahella ganghwensis]